jgi:hypothetical protein
MSNNKEKSNNIKSEENKIGTSSPHWEQYKKQAELDLTLHNKLLQNIYARNKLNQEVIKFKLSLIEYANKVKLNVNEKEIEILLNNFIVILYKKCGFYITSKL